MTAGAPFPREQGKFPENSENNREFFEISAISTLSARFRRPFAQLSRALRTIPCSARNSEFVLPGTGNSPSKQEIHPVRSAPTPIGNNTTPAIAAVKQFQPHHQCGRFFDHPKQSHRRIGNILYAGAYNVNRYLFSISNV